MKSKMTTIWPLISALPSDELVNKVHLMLSHLIYISMQCVYKWWMGLRWRYFLFFLLFSLRSIMCLHTFYLIIMCFLVNGFRIRKWKYSIAEDDLINAHSRHSKSQTGGEHTDLAEESRCSGVFFFPLHSMQQLFVINIDRIHLLDFRKSEWHQ